MGYNLLNYNKRAEALKSNNAKKQNDPYRSLKTAIWIYFYLLIFEGALRKWFLPFLATPLLLVRDPIVIWAIIKAFKQNVLFGNGYTFLFVTIGAISIFTATLLGHGNLIVALYGARPFMIYVPFIFIMGRIFNEEDVIKIGHVTLWISLIMTVLITLQFYSPQSAWVNRGVGGDEAGAGFSGALGYMRPPGTFSFTNGTTLFYSFLSGYVFYFWLNPQKINNKLLIAATIGLCAAIPLSISRTLMFSVAVVALFVIFSAARKPKYLIKLIGAGFGLVLLFLILSQIPIFSTATTAFAARFDTANEQEGGLQGTLGERYLGSMGKAFNGVSDMPFFGYGTGIFSNVGSKILSGSLVSGVSEGELSRLIAELGLFVGLVIILMRVGLSFTLLTKSYNKLARGNLLPWSLLGFQLLQGFQANWSQATSLGFSIFATGLVYSSMNKFKGSKYFTNQTAKKMNGF